MFSFFAKRKTLIGWINTVTFLKTKSIKSGVCRELTLLLRAPLWQQAGQGQAWQVQYGLRGMDLAEQKHAGRAQGGSSLLPTPMGSM